MSYVAKILADSVNPVGVRLTTMEVTFPRFILAEFNTHRMLSRSSASSRAIPVRRRIDAILADPFVPEAFGANRPGMQATEALSDMDAADAREAWLIALRNAVMVARAMNTIHVHKQHANRLLEPFSWHTAIVTATEWSNFFALRCHPDAQPEFQRIATMMRDAMNASEPRELESGEWHRPFCDDLQLLQAAGYTTDDINRICCGRAARVSYETHDGRRDPSADYDLTTRLIEPGHMAPFEHVAMANFDDECRANFRGWTQYRREIPHEADFGMRPAK